MIRWFEFFAQVTDYFVEQEKRMYRRKLSWYLPSEKPAGENVMHQKNRLMKRWFHLHIAFKAWISCPTWGLPVILVTVFLELLLKEFPLSLPVVSQFGGYIMWSPYLRDVELLKVITGFRNTLGWFCSKMCISEWRIWFSLMGQWH